MKYGSKGLGGYHKGLEKSHESKIPFYKHVVIRVDGHHFSSFTKGLIKPFDNSFHLAMVETSKNLLSRFSASTVYTQSDEITLIIPATYKKSGKSLEFNKLSRLYDRELIAIHKETKQEYIMKTVSSIVNKVNVITFILFNDDDKRTVSFPRDISNSIITNPICSELFEYDFYEVENNQIFGGRLSKILSLVSAFTTKEFNKHFETDVNTFLDNSNCRSESFESNESFDKYKEYILKRFREAYFDARCYGVNKKTDAFTSIMWRIRDALKNSKAMFAQAYCSHKSLLNKNSDEMIEFTKDNTNRDWHKDLPDALKYGILIKKEQFVTDVTATIKGKDTLIKDVTRSRLIAFSKDFSSFSEDGVSLIMSKYVM